MGLIITPQAEIAAYYLSDDVSQSVLKKSQKRIGSTATTEENIDNKPHIIIGKAVDMLLTGEKGEFEDTYYVSAIEKKPSDTVAAIIQHVVALIEQDYAEYLGTVCVKGLTEVSVDGEYLVVEQDDLLETAEIQITPFPVFAGQLHNWDAYILDACLEATYQSRWGNDAKLKAIIEPGSVYFQDLINAFGKVVIDATTNNTIQSIVMSLKTNARTSKYFNRNMQEKLENVTFIYQLPIFFKYRNTKCKALLDLVIVVRDEQGKILMVEGIDLKTMAGNTYNFLSNIKMFGYQIQAAWYSQALMDYYALEGNSDLLAPFKFIVESSTFPGKPLVYEMSKSFLEIGKNGKEAINLVSMDIDGNSEMHTVIPAIEGFEQLFDMYVYHEDNGWHAEQEVIEADLKGTHLVLDWNGFVAVND